MDRLEAMQVFVAAADEGSLSAANDTPGSKESATTPGEGQEKQGAGTEPPKPKIGAVGVLGVSLQHFLQRTGIARFAIFDPAGRKLAAGGKS
mgnify:CR=1 FL=1